MKRRDFLLTAAALAGAPALPQSAARQHLRNIRGVQRLFTSEVEDKPWFYDREMWPRYTAMLAENYFNRFNLSYRNLETLRFISEQTASHGLHFQLGLWMHGYPWKNSPHPNYTIQG